LGVSGDLSVIVTRALDPAFVIRYVSVTAGTLSSSLLETIGRLRIRAWEADGERPAHAPATGSIWLDHHDDTAEHFVVEREGTVVAAARVSLHERESDLPDREIVAGYTEGLKWPVASINRLAVAPEARGCGLARALDIKRIELAERAEGMSKILATTHIDGRISWLQQCGFRILGASHCRLVMSRPTFVLARPVKRWERPHLLNPRSSIDSFYDHSARLRPRFRDPVRFGG
jgi:GNAT superfamily N-acetyltransferase